MTWLPTCGMLRIGIDTHAITSHFSLPFLIRHPGGLVVEMTDGTVEYNAVYRHNEGSTTTW